MFDFIPKLMKNSNNLTISRGISLQRPLTFSISYMSSINMRHSRHRATFLRHPPPSVPVAVVDLFDLCNTLSGTLCQLSNMID